MADADPGEWSILFLQVNPGIVVSFIAALFFLFIYSFVYSYAAVILNLDGEKLKNTVKQGRKRAEDIIRLRQLRQEFLHETRVLECLSLVFMTGCLTFGLYQAGLSLWPEPLVGPIFVLMVVGLLIVSFILLSWGTEYAAGRAKLYSFDYAADNYPFYSFLSWLTRPIIRSTRALSRKLLIKRGLDPDEDDLTISEEELVALLEQQREEDSAKPYGQTLLENIFDFEDKSVSECMTHRIDVIALELQTPVEEILSLLMQESYTRYPVYEEDIDHIVGFVLSRDILFFLLQHPKEEFSLNQFLRPAHYVPESQSLASLFKEMQAEVIHLAIVVDEYGGTSGIITMEDVLEELVGQIEDEYDKQELTILPLSQNVWQVNPGLPLDDLADYFDEEFPVDEFDTVAGLVIDLLDHIPDENEYPETRWGDYIFKVEKMQDRRITKLSMRYAPQLKVEAESLSEGPLDEEA